MFEVIFGFAWVPDDKSRANSDVRANLTPFFDAFFTMSSATSQTGLIVQDTGSYFSFFGQMIILIGMQIGGIGIMILSAAFAVLVAKEAFGGTGMNILNPALTARAFAFFAYPTYMSGNKVWVSEASNIDAISGETILGTLAAGGKVNYSAMEMFQGSIPGSIAETSTLWVAVGALILILTGIGSWRIIVGGILGASFMGFLFNLWAANELMSFSWINHLIVGGFAFGIVFMATDPVSAAQTNQGKWIYGVLVGICIHWPRCQKYIRHTVPSHMSATRV